MVNVGGEIIASDVIVPGAVTTLSDPNADLRAINVGSDLKAGLETLSVVEQSINESSQEPLQQGQDNQPGGTTAYEISRLEANANTVLGLFLQMISKHVKDFGKLRLGDILQYLTVPEVMMIEGDEDADLVYKTLFVNAKGNGKNKKIAFDKEVPDEMSKDEHMQVSYDILINEQDKNLEIYRVNPSLFRDLKYKVMINPDVLNPRSEDLERAYGLETYDRMVAAPPGMFDPEATAKLLLSTNPKTKNDKEDYLAKQPQPGAVPPTQPTQPGQMPAAGNAPLNAAKTKSPLSTGAAPSAVPALG